jgi:NTE family protein
VSNHDFLTDGQALRLISRHLGEMAFDDAALPLHIVATDQSTGDEVVLTRGAIEDALMASAAIPGILPPVQMGDGFWWTAASPRTRPSPPPSPWSRPHLCAADRLQLRRAPGRKGLADHAMNALNLLIARQMKADIAHRDQVDLRVAPALCPLNVSALDYSQSADLIDRARRLTRAWLQSGKAGTCESADHSTLHLHDSTPSDLIESIRSDSRALIQKFRAFFDPITASL